MALRRDEAVVIRAMNYGEADKIVSLYTPRFGKVKGIAKGARKPKNKLSYSLEPFNLGQLLFFERENVELCSIRSFDVMERFDELRRDLKKLSFASASVELVDAVSVEGVPDERGFELLVEYLSLMRSSNDPELLTYAFALRFMAQSGFKPQLELCVSCLRPINSNPAFNPVSGGLICRGCLGSSPEAFPIEMGTARTMRKLMELDLGLVGRVRASERCRREMREAIRSFIRHQTERELRSFQFMETLERMIGHEDVSTNHNGFERVLGV